MVAMIVVMNGTALNTSTTIAVGSGSTAMLPEEAGRSSGKLWFLSWVIMFTLFWKANANMQVSCVFAVRQ